MEGHLLRCRWVMLDLPGAALKQAVPAPQLRGCRLLRTTVFYRWGLIRRNELTGDSR